MPDIVVYPNLDPRILVVSAPATEITMQELVDLVREWEDSTFGMGFPYIISGAGKEDLGGGVSVGITNTLINARLRFEARPAPLSTGVCTADDALGKTLNATGADFIADTVTPGCTVYNSTTGAMETVITVDSTSVFSFTLKSGTRQTWLTGDNFVVYPNELCSVTGGNLVAVDSNGNTIDPIMPSPNNYIVRTSSASATLQELSAIQYSSFADGVWISTTGTAGTAYPKGTPASPVNNLADAHTIIAVNGFTKMFFLSDWTFPNGTVMSGHELWGQGLQKTTFTFESGCILALCEVFNAEVTGNETGIVGFVDCLIYDLGSIGLLPSSVNVLAKNCLFKGTVTLPSNYSGELTAVDCWALPDDNGNPPIVDMGDSTANLQLRNWSGLITLKNCTNEIDVRIFLTSGGVTLDPSVTAGDFLFAGVGTLTNNSTSVTALNTDGLMSKETITQISWSMVHVDADLGLPGTTFPLGTASDPVNNMEDAKTIAIANNIWTFHVDGNVALASAFQKYTFIARAPNTTTIDINGQDVAYADFNHSTIDGTTVGTIHTHDCIFNDGVSGLEGTFVGGFVVGAVSFAPTGTAVFKDVGGGGSLGATIDLTDTAIVVSGTGLSGVWSVKNSTSPPPNIIQLEFQTGLLTLEASCTGGVIVIAGIIGLTDNSTGASVNTDGILTHEIISQAVWDEPIADHLIADTMGHEMYHQAYGGIVHVNAITGVAGTTFPAGTRHQPCNNLTDALSIASVHYMNTIHFEGNYTINGENVTGYTLAADRSLGNAITITSMDNTGTCYFTDLTVSGALTGAVRFTTCVLGNLTGYDGGAKNCLLTGDVYITGSGANYFTDCDTYVTGYINKTIHVGAHYLNLIRCRGAYSIADYTGTAVLALDFSSAIVTIESSCVSGSIIVSGIVSLTDNSSAGCAVIDGTLTEAGTAAAVADEDIIKSIDKKTKLIPGLL